MFASFSTVRNTTVMLRILFFVLSIIFFETDSYRLYYGQYYPKWQYIPQQYYAGNHQMRHYHHHHFVNNPSRNFNPFLFHYYSGRTSVYKCLFDEQCPPCHRCKYDFYYGCRICQKCPKSGTKTTKVKPVEETTVSTTELISSETTETTTELSSTTTTKTTEIINTSTSEVYTTTIESTVTITEESTPTFVDDSSTIKEFTASTTDISITIAQNINSRDSTTSETSITTEYYDSGSGDDEKEEDNDTEEVEVEPETTLGEENRFRLFYE